MDLSLDIFALLVAVAMAAGFVDAIAGGGGLLTVPAMLAAGIPPVAALGTNKVQSCFGTSMACFTYLRAGHIRPAEMALPVALAFSGAAAGAVAVQWIDPTILAALVPALLVAVAAYVLLSPRMADVDRHQRVGAVGYGVAAGVVGFYDGFFGPGAGAFYTVSLIALMGFGLMRATANAKLLNVASNLASVVVLGLGGKVLWPLGLAMAVAAMVGGRLGSIAALRFGGNLIRPFLVVVSLALTVKLLVDPANPIAQALWAAP